MHCNFYILDIYNKMRVLTNSKFGLFYSNIFILTPTFSKVPIEKNGKTPIFSGKQHFSPFFQILVRTLSNKFNFWNIHGIMNTSDHLQS